MQDVSDRKVASEVSALRETINRLVAMPAVVEQIEAEDRAAAAKRVDLLNRLRQANSEHSRVEQELVAAVAAARGEFAKAAEVWMSARESLARAESDEMLENNSWTRNCGAIHQALDEVGGKEVGKLIFDVQYELQNSRGLQDVREDERFVLGYFGKRSEKRLVSSTPQIDKHVERLVGLLDRAKQLELDERSPKAIKEEIVAIRRSARIGAAAYYAIAGVMPPDGADIEQLRSGLRS